MHMADLRFIRMPIAALSVAPVILTLAALFLGGHPMTMPDAHADDAPPGPRAAAWKTVDKALEEGKPKTAIEALGGVEQGAVADGAWAEAARAIATRILCETGDRPGDDPERLILLAGAMEKAPPETLGVLEAIRANWTWGFFMQNRWRFQQRTAGGTTSNDRGDDLQTIAEWDLPSIVGEIRKRFAVAVGNPGSPEQKALQSLPVAEWSAIIQPGTLSDAYRPTVWDVVVRDALEFAVSGERGLVAPEDVFELVASSPALGTLDEFLAWQPEADEAVTDLDSPLLEAAKLYRSLLAFHRSDADRTALLAADLDRILWASAAVVSQGDAADLADRKRDALEKFIDRAGEHETASLARFHLASLIQQGDGSGTGDGDLIEARAIALNGAETHPKSPGGAMCKNLIAQIESKELSMQTERSWAEPWPSVRVSYRNLTKVHLRIAKADWMGRLKAGKPQTGWMDDADRQAILALPTVRTQAVDLPATDDYRQRSEDIPVGTALDAKSLEPGPYWVIASQKADFGEADNVVQVALVWVTRLAVVAEQQRQTFAKEAAADQRVGKVSGHVVDMQSGEPVAGATVTLFVREQQGNYPQKFSEAGTATSDQDGRYEMRLDQGREYVVQALATVDGRRHEAATDATSYWRNIQPESQATIVLVTDRGMHRPGQIVFYKGIACASNIETGEYRALEKREIDVVFRDANGREVAKARHTTTANGSFHGNFPIPSGALPGQWSILAQAPGVNGFSGGVGVRVEEYKRPKFLVKLAAPEKSTPLGGEVVLSGTATTYTGVSVAGAKVRWHVERTARFPLWCRWFFPSLPFDGGGQRIARGTAVTDADGRFSITFTSKPDRSVPKESLPVFTYRVVADVTDASGETRSDERSVNAGYTDTEASLSTEAWQATGADGKPAAVAITLTTTTLDGQPRGAAGTLIVSKLVQPAEMSRRSFFDAGSGPGPRPIRGRRGQGRAVVRPAPQPQPNPADPETWASGEAVVKEQLATDKATGKVVATATLPAGIYKAVFEIPAAGDVPAVKAERLIEVIDADSDRYPIKRALVLTSRAQTVEPGGKFSALVGTGYGNGRALVEISQSGKILKTFWTEAGRTQWPLGMKVGDEHRGGFTVRAWMVRDGRLHMESQTVDVPWTNKKLSIAWERFTRRLEPGAKEIWRAKIASVADPIAGPATPTLAEMVATLYDQSLDALAPHQWPTDGLMGLFRRESSWLNMAFTNSGESFNQILGSFATSFVEVPELSYRELRAPFGSPLRGGWPGGLNAAFGGRRMAKGAMMREMAAPMAMAAAPADAMADGLAMNEVAKRQDASPGRSEAPQDKQSGGPGGPAGSSAAAAPPPRKNLVETAFFLPTLSSDKDGTLTIEFTLPDTLTTWQFKGLAHDASLRSSTIVDSCVAAKSLMVEPVVPRFLREGDVVQIPVKVSNTSTGRLAGNVKFSLTDARTNDSRDGLVDGPRELSFDLAAGESKPVVFTVKVADGTETLRYLATGSSGKAADGEEAMLVVLPRRVLVSESVPVTLRGPGERKVSLERLVKSAGTDIRSQSLVVQAASNPAWYAVLALPSIMEQADESTETLFTRLYANSLARHLATSDPRIGKVFEQWKGTAAAGKAGALESPLEKNTDLVKTLLAETPWVRDAVDEKEARARIALLFDATRADNETQAAVNRLQSLRNGDGGWPWFPGGQTCDSVTLGILAGLGRLRTAGVKAAMPGGNDLVQPAIQTIPWLDGRLVEEKKRAEKRWAGKLDDIVLTPIGVYALYARSFFKDDAPPQGEAAEAIRWAFGVGRKCWTKLDARLTQGQLAIALARSGDKKTALSIIDSLKQRAVDADVKPGAEKDSWQGMWWRDPHPGWWSWTYAPIATQTIMIEAFDEVAGDRDAVEALKVWLLSQKRTSQWPGSRATADAVSALLGRGEDLLGSQDLVTVTVGGERVQPGKALGAGPGPEAGTGFFEERFTRREILPTMGEIVVAKQDKGVAFGGIHWQYLDDISSVPAAGREELSIEKQLFIKRMTKAGPELVPAAKGGVTAVELGDELVVRLVVKSDRDYEFLELRDHRPSLTEPVDVLSGWRWGDGAGWYVAVRDASTQLFFERLPRGTHVFEYSLRAAHRGTASSGFATIQSRYAPEFSAHSASIPVEVK